MPKSKRSTVVSLTKTSKKGFEGKEQLMSSVRECVDEYEYLWLFSVKDMRNTFLKEVRNDLKTSSKIFLGKNQVMAKALGKSPEEEYKSGLSELSKSLNGEVGLLFTSKPCEEITAYFDEFTRADYARSGTIANEDVVIPEGPLQRGADKMPHNMEPLLRKLGMPTVLDNGIVTLLAPYTICKDGDVLSTDQAHLLKLFYHQLAEFKVELLCYYHDGKITNVDQ